MPIGRGDRRGVGGDLLGGDEAAIARVKEESLREFASGDRGDCGNSYLPIGKRVGEFRRHCRGVPVGRAERRLGLGESAIELGEAKPERGGDLHHIDDASRLQPRGLQMRAADVPADNAWHVIRVGFYLGKCSSMREWCGEADRLSSRTLMTRSGTWM